MHIQNPCGTGLPIKPAVLPVLRSQGNVWSLLNLQVPGLREADADFNHLPFAVS